jgi:hypothetical protein
MRHHHFDTRAAAGAVATIGLLIAGGLGCGRGTSTAGAGGGDGGASVVSNGGDAAAGPDGAGAGGAGAGNRGGVDGGGSVDGGSPAPSLPQTDLTTPTIDVQGGSAVSAGGQGQNGGTIHFVAKVGLSIDPTLAAPATTTPAVPAGATPLTTAELLADATIAGAVVIDGMVSSGGTDPVRQIVAGGDVFVRGTLRTADLGGSRQGLTLRAGGTVYVDGAIDLSGSPGTGQAGGALTIVAKQLVVAGTLTTAGGSGATTGGPGGGLTLQIGGDLVLAGAVVARGGFAQSTGADAIGGNAGILTIDSDGSVTFAGTVDGRGGAAVAAAAGGHVAGGAAGAIKVGESAPPPAIAVLVPVLLTGGDGAAGAGAGGTANLEPHAGDLLLAGLLDVSGGSSASKPGPGGAINGHPGPDTTDGIITAGVVVTGQVLCNGGSVTPGGSGNGADGGVIKLVVLSSAGNMTIAPAGKIKTDGGRSGGTGQAGGGGLMYLFTRDGNASIAGLLEARGGDAPDPGGVGGTGGFVYVFTDDNHGGTQGGVLIIETTGLIDVSGGDGTTGGSARSDGKPQSVATWPVVQTDEYDVQNVAALINSDGKHGPATGWIDNQGHIVARGGHSNGAGGDVQYHGKTQSGNETPIEGNVDMSGDGTGAAGDWAGE